MMFVDFKRSTLKIPVSDHLIPMEFQFFGFLFLNLIQLNLVWLNIFLCYIQLYVIHLAPSRYLRTVKS